MSLNSNGAFRELVVSNQFNQMIDNQDLVFKDFCGKKGKKRSGKKKGP